MQFLATGSNPPLSGPQGEDKKRIAYTRRSRRILYGEHEEDVNERLKKQIGSVRKSAWGQADLSSNPFKVVWSALSTLYDRWPTATGDDELVSRVTQAGLWPLMSRTQRDAGALREMWMRADVAPDGDGKHELVFEPIFPDLIIPWASPERPTRPVGLYHARRREIDGQLVWAWDRLDISDPDRPAYQVLVTCSGKNGKELVDVTEKLLGAAGWPAYWRDQHDRPVLPYVLYHAARTPHLHDPYQTRELVEATLNVAVLRTHLLHVAKQASWAQRYAVNARVQGIDYEAEGDGNGRSEVVTDPAVVLLLQPIEEGMSPQIGQWAPPAKPADIMEVIEAYERKALAEAGVRPDVTRSSGDPRSGYALAVDRDSQREAQRRFEPQFREGDLQLLELSAMLLNRAEGTSYPEHGGYSIAYHGVPQSAQERKAQREHLLSLLEHGLTDPISAYQELHPGTTDEQALAALRRIRVLQAELSQAPPPQGAQSPTQDKAGSQDASAM